MADSKKKVVDVDLLKGYHNDTVKPKIKAIATDVAQHTTDIAQHATDIAQNIADISQNATDIATLKGEGEGSINKMIDAAFDDFSTKVSDDAVVNTYKELIDYAAENGAEMVTLAGKVTANETAISNLQENAVEYGAVSDISDLNWD